MGSYNLFPIILYILGSTLLIVLIILGIKMIITLTKIDKVVDDINDKCSKLDKTFNVIDRFTDACASINDKIIELTVGAVTSLVKVIKNKKKKGNEEDE